MSQKFIPRRPRGYARIRAKPAPLPGELYQAGFLSASERRDLVAYLTGLRPIWEQRYSAHHPPPPGQTERGLLRPVYWLGTWQFACLDYYRPPKGLKNRAIEAEPFAPVLARLVEKIEALARERFPASDIPRGWTLNTGLVNYYGTRLEAGGKRHDVARVGEHRDFEPGPVASLSLGERALFQFVSSSRPGQRDGVASQTWLADGDLPADEGRAARARLATDPRFAERLRAQEVLRQGLSSLRGVELPAGFEARLQYQPLRQQQFIFRGEAKRGAPAVSKIGRCLDIEPVRRQPLYPKGRPFACRPPVASVIA